jgi:hypothetical protein
VVRKIAQRAEWTEALARSDYRARHGDNLAYPAEERGRRILWRTVTIGIYGGLVALSFWVAQRLHWPGQLMLPAVALPYWAVVTWIWSRSGPYMPRLHGARDAPEGKG